MDKTILVEADFKDGEILIRELDQKQFNVQSALWLFDEDGENWQLLIATSNVITQGLRTSYTIIDDVINALNLDINIHNITLTTPNEPIVLLLKEAIPTDTKQNECIRLSNHTINNVYIKAAFIYRL